MDFTPLLEKAKSTSFGGDTSFRGLLPLCCVFLNVGKRRI
jgi:hypothetical protein